MEISKVKIGKYALLRHKKYRDKHRLFMVQGRKAVDDTLPFFDLEALIEDEAIIRKLSTLENLPDVIAVFKMPARTQLMDIEPNSFTLVLDGIQDPGNLGTIIRTCHWFGIERIFCSRDTVDLYNPKVVMSTMGSIAKVKVVYTDLEELFEKYPLIPIYGLLLEGSDIFKESAFPPGFVLMGSEGHGISTPLLKFISKSLTIPAVNSSDHPDSLNVAIATAITLSQLIK